LTRGQRWLAAGTLGAAWALSGESLLGLLFLAAAARAALGRGAEQQDQGALAQYVGIAAALTALTRLRVF
jgi:hypothetical protein